MIDMKPKYEHTEVEAGKYAFWLQHHCFEADGDPGKPPFTIVIPPPNVTGKLHLGHTWDTTLQDIIIRRKRMQGFDALYLPGMDHAGIATQAKVDQRLKSQGISRFDLGREKYLEAAWNWKEEYASFIRDQWQGIGLSLDYRRERFTLDQGLSEAVNEVFVRLFEKGYIYRGERIINWDVEAKTALSNIEIEHVDIQGAFYHITYPFADGTKGGLTVATTRPETMFGDVALMVHPDDGRFAGLIGKQIVIPTTNRKIPVIADTYVDRAFGTGIVKVTPAHDPNDFEVGKRHKLEMPLCMNEDGTMNARAGKYQGMERFAARKALVADLKAAGLLQKVEPVTHNVGHSERTGVIVEPRLSKQWFVRMDELAKNAIDKNTVNFVPERFKKTFTNWMEAIEDWCISRQLWWGHRIPVWYKGEEIYCGRTAPEGAGWKQDEDVLDTWFSSALWPFSTLGWPHKTADLERYYPTDCLVTGYDIIFFWVARMIFQGIEFTAASPFKDCLIHGLIRDADGRKMSKSLGNGVDPQDVIAQYGADALRYFISTNSSPGLDLRYEPEKVEAAWNFINKLWNISRYVLMNTEGAGVGDMKLDPATFGIAEQWIVGKLNETLDSANADYEKYEFGEAAKKLYNFAWNDFASWYVEMAKLTPESKATKAVLLHVLSTIVKALHPLMPFVTEEIWQKLPHDGISIMRAPWPVSDGLAFPVAAGLSRVFDRIVGVRQIRNEYNVAPSKPIEVLIKTESGADAAFLEINRRLLEKFLNTSRLLIAADLAPADHALTVILPGMTLYLPLGSLVDLKAETDRLEKEIIRLENEIRRSDAMLENPSFLQKAPEAKIVAEKQKRSDYAENLRLTQERLEAVKN
ncbi:MAG TPA: valine--tRNA ligase [Acholeplasmatales bacterium]|nr:valine--tRNA ligase [Acholeplasmatales bacterium]